MTYALSLLLFISVMANVASFLMCRAIDADLEEACASLKAALEANDLLLDETGAWGAA